MRKYIVIGCARSGKTVTHLAIKGHPNVYALNDEVKIRKLSENPLSLVTHGSNLKSKENIFIRNLFETLINLNPVNKNNKAKGIKVAVSKPDDAKLFVKRIQHYFPDVYIIFVKQNNLVAQYSSMARAKKNRFI